MILALFNAIAALPALFSLLEKFINFISDQLDQAKQRKAIADLAKASQDARQKKDTSGLDEIFDPSKKK